MSATIDFATIITDDFVELFEFYRWTFELDEVTELRNDRFRALRSGECRLSFTPESTYASLGIEEWAAPTGSAMYLTFEVASDDEVAHRTERAASFGARVIRAPYETHYGSWQSVVADIGGNVLRINHFR